jgi:hypothetical protein
MLERTKDKRKAFNEEDLKVQLNFNEFENENLRASR